MVNWKSILALLLVLVLLTGCNVVRRPAVSVPPEEESPSPPVSQEVTPPLVDSGDNENTTDDPGEDEKSEVSAPDNDNKTAIEQRRYKRIQAQTRPAGIETRDGVDVLRPYMTCDFFSMRDIPNVGEQSGASGEKNCYGFYEDYLDARSIWEAWEEDIQATASSTLPDYQGMSYRVQNLFDGSRTTAWCENVAGTGIGQSIEVIHMIYERGLPNADVGYPFQYTSLCIVNGYAKSDDLFQKNARIKTLKLYVDNRLHAYIELEDTMTPQYFALYDIPALTGTTTAFRFEIADVYRGSAYEDACLTGIVFGVSSEGFYSP